MMSLSERIVQCCPLSVFSLIFDLDEVEGILKVPGVLARLRAVEGQNLTDRGVCDCGHVGVGMPTADLDQLGCSGCGAGLCTRTSRLPYSSMEAMKPAAMV